MRAAIYTRVSREEQTRGHSLESQEADAREYADTHGHEVVGVYTDPGESGANPNRPGLQSLISDAEAGKFDLVLVRHVDRLSRDAGFALQLSKTLEADIVPFGEGDSTSEQDRFMFGIRALVAEQERSRTRERMMRGKKAAAAKGRWHGGEPPYGTRPEPHPDGGSILVRDEDEAKVIRDVYTWMVDEGLGPYQVAQRLNEAGVHTRRGRSWSRQLLKFMLRNPRLMGTAHWWGEEVEVPQLLTKAEWVRLQSIFEANSRMHRNTSGEKAPYPLSGRVFDPLGHHWVGGRRKGTRYYHCSQHPSCDWRVRRWIRADEIEQLVVDAIPRAYSGPVPALLADVWEALDEDYDPADLEQARAKVDQLEERLGTLYVMSSDLDAGAFKRATSQLEEELETSREVVADHEAAAIRQELTVDWFVEVSGNVVDFVKEGDLEKVVSLMSLRVDLTGDLTFDLKVELPKSVVRERFT